MGCNEGAWDCTSIMNEVVITSEVEELLRETKKLEEEQEMLFLIEKQLLDTQHRLLLLKKKQLEEQVNNLVSKTTLSS